MAWPLRHRCLLHSFFDDNNDAAMSVGDRITYLVRVAPVLEDGIASCTNPTGNFYGAEQIGLMTLRRAAGWLERQEGAPRPIQLGVVWEGRVQPLSLR